MKRGQPARRPVEKELHRTKIADMYVRGCSQAAIAAAIGVSQTVVSEDLKIIRTEWLRARVEDYDLKQADELAKIDNLESEAWEGWKRSRMAQEVYTTKEVSGDVDKLEEGIRKQGRDGSVEFLKVIQWCIEQRCKIFGFYAPTKIEIKELDSLIEREIALLAENQTQANTSGPDYLQ